MYKNLILFNQIFKIIPNNYKIEDLNYKIKIKLKSAQ